MVLIYKGRPTSQFIFRYMGVKKIRELKEIREHKYRGKRIDNGEWVYGYYISSSNGENGTLTIKVFAGESVLRNLRALYYTGSAKRPLAAHWTGKLGMKCRKGG